MAKKKRKGGLGARRKGGKVSWGNLLPPAIGIGLAAGSTLAIRAFLEPTPGDTSGQVFRWAPAIGAGVGAVGGGLAMYYTGGATQAAVAATAAGLTGAAHLGMEWLIVDKPGAVASLSAPAGGAEGTTGRRGRLGAVVPEYPTDGRRRGGTGAVMTEQLGANQQNQGENLSLGGVVNQGAFGYQPYRVA